MKIINRLSLLVLFSLALGMTPLLTSPAEALSTYFTSRGCADCHSTPVVASCNACHYHGNRTLKATTGKTAYAPGETVSVTLTSGSTRTGWIKANLYDQNNTLVASSSGSASGFGGSTVFPATLSAAAPLTPGTYTWKMAYFGNQNGTGSGDVHSEAAVATNAFTVAAPADTTAPTVSAFTLPATATSLTVPVSTLTASDNVAVTGYLVTAGATAPAASATGWNATKPASVTAGAPGSVTFYAWAKDAAGNVSASRSATVVITLPPAADTVKPTLTVSMLDDGTVTANPTLNVSGKAADDVALQAVTVNGSSVQFDAAGNFSTAVELVEGANPITVVATDGAGNSTTLSRTVTYLAAAPELTVTAPVDNLVSAKELLVVAGLVGADDTVTVSVNDGAPQVASVSDGSFSATIYLEPGLNTIAIESVDPAGNISNAKRTVLCDTGKPTVAITDPAEDLTVSTPSLTITGAVADALSDVTVTLTAGGKSYTPAISEGAFSQQVTFSQGGQHTVTVTATDEAGNQASASRNIILVSEEKQKKEKKNKKNKKKKAKNQKSIKNATSQGQAVPPGRLTR